MKGVVASIVPDRRSAPRHNLRVPLCFRTRNNSKMSEWKNVLEPKNISETGLLFTSDSRLALGTRVEVLMETGLGTRSESTSRVCWSGQVVRLEPINSIRGTHDIAVKFMCYEVLHSDKMETVLAS